MQRRRTSRRARPRISRARKHDEPRAEFVRRSLENLCDVTEPIGTNTDLTHSPRYKPFSALVRVAARDPLRTHEGSGTIAARRYDHSDLNRGRRKKNMDSPCGGTDEEREFPLSFVPFFLSVRNVWTALGDTSLTSSRAYPTTTTTTTTTTYAAASIIPPRDIAPP